mgnify:CR=1 FL=1
MPAPAASSPPPRTHAERRAMLATMRTGKTLRITVYDATKRAITIEVPLLGFGLAFDKATK